MDFLEPGTLAGAGKVCRLMRELTDDPWVVRSRSVAPRLPFPSCAHPFLTVLHVHPYLQWRSLCMEKFPFVGGGAENNDWKRIYLRRSRLQKGWDGGKSGDFSVTSMRGHDGYINCIDILKNQAISGGSTGQIKVWRTNTSKLSYDCIGHTDVVSSVKFNDIYILSGSADRTVKLWDTQTGTLLRSMDAAFGVTSIAFDANNVISCGHDAVDIHDIRSAQRLVHQTRGHVVSKALFVDEHLFAVSRSDGVMVFDTRGNTDVAVHSLNRAATQMEIAGNELLALTCGQDVVLYNAKTGANAWTCRLPSDSPVTALKADSATIVLGTKAGQLMILRHRNPAIRTVSAHEGGVNGLQFDTHRVVTAGADNSIKVWDVKNGKMLYTLLGGSLQLRGAAKAHPTRPGCSNLVYDENRIVGSFANVLKSFNFGGAE